MKIQITEEDYNATTNFLEHKPKWKDRFYSNYNSTVLGALAEHVVSKNMGLGYPKIFDEDDDDGYDVMWNGLKFDIKNHKHNRGKVFPSKLHTEEEGKREGYIFTYIDETNKVLEVLGYMLLGEVKEKGILYEKGERVDELAYPLRASAYVVEVKDLTKIKRW